MATAKCYKNRGLSSRVILGFIIETTVHGRGTQIEKWASQHHEYEILDCRNLLGEKKYTTNKNIASLRRAHLRGNTARKTISS